MLNRSKMRGLAALGCVGASMLALSSAAQAQQLVTAFTPQNVTAALQAMGVQGAATETINLPDGSAQTVIRFQVDGVNHNAALEVCNTGAPGCLGLNLVTVWNMPSTADVNVVNDFNLRANFSKAFAIGSDVIVARYAISDGGVAPKNIEANIGNHVAMSIEFVNFYNTSASAATISLKKSASAALLAAPKDLEGLAPLLGRNDLSTAPKVPSTVIHGLK